MKMRSLIAALLLLLGLAGVPVQAQNVFVTAGPAGLPGHRPSQDTEVGRTCWP